MSYEQEERRLISMLEEVIHESSAESCSEYESDHCSEHNLQSGTEQEVSDHVHAAT